MTSNLSGLLFAGSLAGLALSALSGGAQAQGTDRQATVWAAACAACHGTEGRASQGMPSLAGRSQAELYAMLVEFKAGKRPATVMHQQASGYTDEELRRIAAWFATQARQ